MKLEKMTDGAERATKRWYDDACGTALGMELFGERWSVLVVRELMFGARRFGEIKANLPGISANVLTQRLDGLEQSGIVVRRRLPSPANVQVYDLTDWGRESAPVLRMLGGWAARSPRHDPFAFMSSASAMMSLQTLVDPDRIAGEPMTIAFRLPDDAFVVRVAAGAIDIRRGEGDADVVFTGDTMALRSTIYGKLGTDGPGLLARSGDPGMAERFIGLFKLPDKIGAQG